ncbi:unnamed protein product [Blepharisma stoltei]|uniref:Uncharacterized protein n=1 Tax=Blepharisma stoltei TaxID=1481888 RepID=A0AAU9J9I8_9CILI|nr:unnamed protein product [Blepharisma stoltei]
MISWICCTLLLLIRSSNASDYVIFPRAFSQYFCSNASEITISLTEAFLSGEENKGEFGISLWIKISDSTDAGQIFDLYRIQTNYAYINYFPLLYYDSSTIKLTWKNSDYPILNQVLSHSITSPNQWKFIGISCGFSHYQSLLCINQGSGSVCSTGTWNADVGIKFNSYLKMGGSSSFNGRVGDFKLHLNQYFQKADWDTQYSLRNSCPNSCSSNLICYSQADQWCQSHNRFLALVQPYMYSTTPYTAPTVTSDIIYGYDEIYLDWSSPLSSSTSFTVTGWMYKSGACSSGTFLKIASTTHSHSTVSTTTSGSCYMSFSLHDTITSADIQLTQSSYPGPFSSWTFFSATSDGSYMDLYVAKSLASISHDTTTATHSALLLKPSEMVIYVGGTDSTLYGGYYADIRLYPGVVINLADLTSNIINHVPDYLFPACTLSGTGAFNQFSGIWTCQKCPDGYWMDTNGMCNKCHESCSSCSGSIVEYKCTSCASGYYSQPTHSSLCLNYCPFGYYRDSTLNACTGTAGNILDVSFENNLKGDFTSNNILLSFGMYSDQYYPTFDYLDPSPAIKRGIFLSVDRIEIIPQSSTDHKLFGTDFTIQMWAMLLSYKGCLFSSSVSDPTWYYVNYVSTSQWNRTHPIAYFLDDYGRLEAWWGISMYGDGKTYLSPVAADVTKTEWALYAISIKFDDTAITSELTMMRNTFSYSYSSISGYYKEAGGTRHWIGSSTGEGAFHGFLYSLSLYNYARTPAQVQGGLGSCSSCSACPLSLNYCISTCSASQYVDGSGSCVDCSSSCGYPCSRSGTCNLCYDDLCYSCTKYDIGTCIKCVDNATLSSGQCSCSVGFIRKENTCVDDCGDGYFLNLVENKCSKCPDYCKTCFNSSTCMICYSDYLKVDSQCTCPDGSYIDQYGKCSQCRYPCKTCTSSSYNCLTCAEKSPVLWSSSCFPCNAFVGYGTKNPSSIGSNDLLAELAQNCTEICGDGRNMGEAECDDGNTINGDGCSANCTVESGWSCSGGSMSNPDTCIDQTPPIPILAYLYETGTGYALALSFSEQIQTSTEMSSNIEISLESTRKTDWTIQATHSIYTIKLNVYDSVATGTIVSLKFYHPEVITDLSGNKMETSKVELSLPTSYTYSYGQAVTTTVTTATTVVVVGGVIGSTSGSFSGGLFNLQALWGMVEMMQLINYLIFLSPKYPDNVKTFLSALSIANGNFIPNPFQMYLVKDDPFPDPPESFLDENFNTDFFMNAGQFLLLWVIILSGIPITFIAYRYFSRFRLVRWIKNAYLYSILLRAGIESFLEISLSVFLQWREIVTPAQNIGYFSLILSFLTFAYLMLTFVIIIWQVTLKPESVLNKEQHERKYGTLYESFKRNFKISTSYLIVQNLRRVLFVLLCVFLYEYPAIQVSLSILLSFSFTLSLILIRPYEKMILGNIVNIASETFYFAAHCIILKFLDNGLSDNERTNLGWGVIALLSVSLLFHLVANLVTQIISILNGIKKAKDWFMKNFANRFIKNYGRGEKVEIDPKEKLKKQLVTKTDDDNENLAYFEGKESVEKAKRATVIHEKKMVSFEVQPTYQDTAGSDYFEKIKKIKK